MTEASLYATDKNPIPDNSIVGWFTGYKKAKLRYAIFKHDNGTPRGTIILLQGRNECIEKYFETVQNLTDMGFWVATYDMRGQGASQRLIPAPDYGHVDEFSDYQHDLALFMEHIVLPDTRGPFYIVAHSTGGLVALASAPELTNSIERMILASPFVELAGQRFSKRAIKTVAALYRYIGLGETPMGKDNRGRGFAGNALTSDQDRFDRYDDLFKHHPDLFLGPPTARWLHTVLKTMPRVTSQTHLTNTYVPTVILAPVLDPITPYAAQEALARNFRAGQIIPIMGAKHEIFAERDVYRSQALAAIDAFFTPPDA